VARVPLLRKATLAERQRADPPLGGLAPSDLVPGCLFLSPGGILEPMLDRAADRLAELLAGCGFARGDRVLNGFSYHLTPGGMLFDAALRRLGATVLPGGPQNTAQLVELMRRADATGFVGIASHLRVLADAMAEDGGGRPPLRLAMAGAEPFADPLRRALEADLGIRCHDLYGTAELGVVAAECAAKQGLHFHPDAAPEVVDPETGDRLADDAAGELVLSIDNPEFPLLRFATGDLVRLVHGRCACGADTARIERVLGRVGASARIRGMLVHGPQLRDFALRAGGLAACCVHVTRKGDRDEVRVEYAPASAAAPPAQAMLEVAFRNACRVRADRFVIAAALPADGFTIVDERSGSGTAERQR
jgi:phenylacetate-CoA ligase